MSINRVLITGNLTRDPELRTTANKTPVLTLGIAVNDRRKNQQTGEWEDYPNFIEATMFGTRAENISKFLTKGSKVAIEGKLHYSSWEKDGKKRSKIDITIDEIEFMTKKQNESAPAQQAVPAQQQMPNIPAPQSDGSYSIYDEDIPL